MKGGLILDIQKLIDDYATWLKPVSYTHLDVYKRQEGHHSGPVGRVEGKAAPGTGQARQEKGYGEVTDLGTICPEVFFVPSFKALGIYPDVYKRQQAGE